MRLRNIIIIIALFAILMGSLIFTSSINVPYLDNDSNDDSNHLNDPNNNLDFDSDSNSNNNINNPNNKPSNSNSNPTGKPASEVSSKPSNSNSNPTSKPASEVSSKPSNSNSNPTTKPANEVSSKPSNPTSKPSNEVSSKPSNSNTNPTNNNNNNNVNENNKPDASTSKLNSLVLGSNNKGLVEIIGPIGNKSSNVKIAYIIGVHPLESKVHNALYASLIAKSSSLNYCYYIYRVNVTNNPNNYDVGRMNGQVLANEFLVPDAISKNYDLVVDIHSNQGTNGGNYKETNFIFAPLNNATSKVFADGIIAKIPPLVYYYPESQTSPSYVTIPIMKSGTPTLIYETYMYESNEITKDYINKLISTIDTLKIK